MGNVRSTHVKQLSERLIEMYPNRFSDFEKNKGILDEMMTFDSSITRNKIAGYIAHSLVKMKKLHSIKVTYQNPNLDKRKKARRRR